MNQNNYVTQTAITTAIFFLLAGAPSIAAKSDALAPGTHKQKIAVDGMQRTFRLHLPPDYGELGPLPLVIVLHGGGANGEHAMEMSGFNEKADEEGFAVAYPDGTGRAKNILLTWNAGRCCEYAMDNDIDDVGFVRAIIEKLEGEFDIVPKRIYATGHSNGGMMAYRLGCEMSDVLAAIAPNAGSLEFEECKPEHPISVIIFHGTADDNVPYEGGRGKKALVKLEKKPVSFAVDFWVKHNGCSEKPKTEKSGNIVIDSYFGGKNGSDVVLYTIEGGTHSWPGGVRVFKLEDPPTDEISATDIMWEFFKEHPKK